MRCSYAYSDTFTMLSDFETADFLSNRHTDVVPEDERTVSHLMVDQIEFADVIILNKTDIVNDETLESIEGTIKTMNRRAKVLRASYGRVDVKEILNTGTFDLEVARTGSGWLEDLHQMMIRKVRTSLHMWLWPLWRKLTRDKHLCRSMARTSSLRSQKQRSTMCATSSTAAVARSTRKDS